MVSFQSNDQNYIKNQSTQEVLNLKTKIKSSNFLIFLKECRG